jgi:N-acetylmuramoyl-L-alanine amidase
MRVRLALLASTTALLVTFPAAASANYPHVIQRGETLSSVAAVDGLSVAAIAAANGMSVNSQLVAGKVLWIPPRAAATSTAASTARTATAQATTVHTTSAPRSTHTSSAASSTGPYPTAERATASEIASIAAVNGVPASFAEAIAWQESGWNNSEVSGVGAVGVMQIVPATWRWIDQYLTPSDPLGPTSAAENIRGGVLLIHQLLAVTGDSYSLTAAAYFQGLASVKKYGMYASTRQYVADVLAVQRRLAG